MLPIPTRLATVVATLSRLGADALAHEVVETLQRLPIDAVVLEVDGRLVLAPYWELFCLEVEAVRHVDRASAARLDWLAWVWRQTLASTPHVSSTRV
jgi:hypothetical protein